MMMMAMMMALLVAATATAGGIVAGCGAGCTALSRLFIMAGNIFLLAHSINGSPAAFEQCSLAEGNRGCLAVFLLQFSILVWGFVNLGLFVWLCYQ